MPAAATPAAPAATAAAPPAAPIPAPWTSCASCAARIGRLSGSSGKTGLLRSVCTAVRKRGARQAIVAVVFEVLAVEGVFAVVDGVVYLVFRHVGQGRLAIGGRRVAEGVLCNGRRVGIGHAGAERCRGGGAIGSRLCGRRIRVVRVVRGIGVAGRIRVVRRGAVAVEVGTRVVGGGWRIACGSGGSVSCSGRCPVTCRGSVRRAAAARRRGSPGQAVALHLLLAQLGDQRRGHRLRDDVELAMAQAFVDDEAHEGLAVHDQALFGRLRRQIGFGLAGKRGVVAEQALVVVGVHQHGVQRGRVLLACSHHLFAPHLLLGLFGDLNRRDGRLDHVVGCSLERVFHLSFELRKEAHASLLISCALSR